MELIFLLNETILVISIAMFDDTCFWITYLLNMFKWCIPYKWFNGFHQFSINYVNMNIKWSPILRDPHSSIYLSIVALKRLGFIKRFINRYVHDITPINVDTIGLNIFYKKFWTMCQTPNSEIWSSKRDDISLIILKPLVSHTRRKS